MPNTTSKKKIFFIISTLLIIVAAIGGYYYAHVLLPSSKLGAADIQKLIATNQSVQLHAIASSDPAIVGRDNWVLANLFVADEPFLSPSIDPNKDTRTLQEVNASDAAGLVNIAKVLTLDNKNPSVADVLAWVVLAEKLRRVGVGTDAFTTYVLPNNSAIAALATSYQKTLAEYGLDTNSASTKQDVILYFVGRQLEELYTIIARNPSYSDGLKQDMTQTMALFSFLNSGTLNNDPAFRTYKNKVTELFRTSSPDGLDIIPEYKLLIKSRYFTSIYSVKKSWNFGLIYFWQQNHIAGKDFAVQDTVPFDLVRNTTLNAITYIEKLYANASTTSELGSFNANGLRVSLALTTAFAVSKKDPHVSEAAATILVKDLFAPIVKLYAEEPQNRFFSFLRAYKNIRSAQEVAALKNLTAKESKSASGLLTILGW
ncbi:MAG: hypothetical protein NT019_01585 [Candidatus Adlerbacteria bacterium]|nr:hypothetical protein [Candidatus Adlerbacteria bacterium]